MRGLSMVHSGNNSPRSPVVACFTVQSPREPFGQSYFAGGRAGHYFAETRDAVKDTPVSIANRGSAYHYERMRLSTSMRDQSQDLTDGRVPFMDTERRRYPEHPGRLDQPQQSAVLRSKNPMDLMGQVCIPPGPKLHLVAKPPVETRRRLPEEGPADWQPPSTLSLRCPAPVNVRSEEHEGAAQSSADLLLQTQPEDGFRAGAVGPSGEAEVARSQEAAQPAATAVGPWPGLDDDYQVSLPSTPRIRTTRSEDEEFVPPSTPRGVQRNPSFSCPNSVFSVDRPAEAEPASPRPGHMLPPIPRPSAGMLPPSPGRRGAAGRGPSGQQPFSGPNSFVDSGLMSPRHAFSPKGPIVFSRDRTFSESPLRRRSPFASSSSEKLLPLPHAAPHFGSCPRMGGSRKQRPSLAGAFDSTDSSPQSSVGRPRCFSSDASSGRSTPPVSMDLKPALTLDVEAIDKAVDAVLEAPSLPKNQPFRRRWSAPNLAGLAELEERRRHEEAETAANGGPDSPELSCSEEEGLPQISEDRPLETGVPTGALQAKISKRRVSEEEPPLALRLEFLQGPCAGMVYTTPAGTTEVTLGRSATNSVEIPLDTISHHHVFIRWDPLQRCWKVTDVGSLNGTTLNKRRISSEQARVRGAPCTLKSDDLLELSNSAILKVTVLPSNLMETELTGPRINVYIKPNRNLGPTCTMDPGTLMAMAHDAAQEAAQDALSVPMSVPDLHLHATTASLRGRDHDRLSQACEDVTAQDLHLPGDCRSALFAVFDGHGGRNAAEQAASLLPNHLRTLVAQAQQGLRYGKVPTEMWTEAFLSTDKEIQGDGGCTATALLLWRSSLSGNCVCLQAANVGDSAALLVNPDTGSHILLTADHRWTNPQEAARVGGVSKSQTRVYGLNISRALGDKFLKDNNLGLSASPHVSQVEVLAPSSLIIMATDGLWDVTTSEKVAEVALLAYLAGRKDTCRVAEALMRHAQDCRTRDDVTVTVIAWEPEAPSA